MNCHIKITPEKFSELKSLELKILLQKKNTRMFIIQKIEVEEKEVLVTNFFSKHKKQQLYITYFHLTYYSNIKKYWCKYTHEQDIRFFIENVDLFKMREDYEELIKKPFEIIGFEVARKSSTNILMKADMPNNN